jgi:Tfp pilus assembly protein PilF
LIYFSSINSSFHFDDVNNIKRNPAVNISDLSFSSLKGAAFPDVVRGGFRPVAYISFAFNYYFTGEDTTSYHVVNIIIHALNAFLIYLVILSLFDYDTAEEGKRDRLALSAFFTALFWLVTPFNSQAVIYIVQRMTLMMTLFFLLAFLFYIKGRKKKNTKYFILSGIFFVLSFLSKQNALVFPAVIVLYELIFIRKGDYKSISKKEKASLIIMTFTLFLPLIFFWEVIHNTFIVSSEIWGFTYYERELTQFRVLVLYLSLLILPLPGRLSLLHDIEKSTSLFSPVTTFFSIIFILFLFALSILRLKKSPYFSFAFLWFFVTISVVSILPVELMYDHRMYMPCIFLVGTFVNYVTEKFYGKRKIVIAALLAITIIWGALTGIRGRTWENEATLWNDVLSKYPNSSLALYNVGNTMIALELYDSAEELFLKALKVNRYKETHQFAYSKLGYVYIKKNMYYKSIDMYQKMFTYGVRNTVDYADAFLNYGNAYLHLDDYNNALINLNKALEIGLMNKAVYKKFNMVYNNLGVAYIGLKKYKEAAINFRKALDYFPNDAGAQRNLRKIEELLNK